MGGEWLQGCGCAVQNSTGMDLIFQCCGIWVAGGPNGPSSPSGCNGPDGPNGSSQHCHLCFTFEPFIEDVTQSAPEPQCCPVLTLSQIYPGFISTCKVFGPAV